MIKKNIEKKMAVNLEKETEKRLLSSIKRFYAEEMEEDIGDLKAMRFLDFCLREIGPSIYNQAVIDAQSYMQDRIAELSDVNYKAEFDYWKKK